MAASGSKQQPQKPPQEYGYAVLAVHPVTRAKITKAVHDEEIDAHKDAAHRNEGSGSQYSHHVKRIKKGTSGGSGGAAPSRNR